MASKEQNNQEQTSIDALNQRLTDAGQAVANNKKIIYWAVGVIVIIAVFILGYVFIYQNPRTNKSLEAYAKVETQALNSDSVAAEQYKKVSDQYGSAAGGNLAAIAAGEALYAEGKYEEAAKYLKKFNISEPVLKANVEILIGDCYVNLKKYDEALGYLKKGADAGKGNSQIAPRALMKMAVIYDEQKKYDQALNCYEQIAAQYPEFVPGNGLTIEAYIAREKARLGK